MHAGRSSGAIFSGLLLSIVVSNSAFAASWSEPVDIVEHVSGAATFALDMVGVGTSGLVASYVRDGVVFVTRSTDNGAVWGDPVDMSATTAWTSDLATYGEYVDLVTGNGTVQYSRSVDGGATFSAPIPLWDQQAPTPPTVAHGPNGLVAVVWARYLKHPKLFIRVSHDDGASWGQVTVLRDRTSSSHHVVAVGSEGISVVVGTGRGMLLRRSADGVTWTDWRSLGSFENVGVGPRLRLTADGDEVILGYMHATTSGIVPAYRRSLDGGATWSPRTRLSKPSGNATAPIFSVDAAGIRVVYGRQLCDNTTCTLNVYYRALSSDGWTTPELVSPVPAYWGSWAAAIAYTDRATVLYQTYLDQTSGGYLQVRSRSL
jgi:hypothetical protein